MLRFVALCFSGKVIAVVVRVRKAIKVKKVARIIVVIVVILE